MRIVRKIYGLINKRFLRTFAALLIPVEAVGSLLLLKMCYLCVNVLRCVKDDTCVLRQHQCLILEEEEESSVCWGDGANLHSNSSLPGSVYCWLKEILRTNLLANPILNHKQSWPILFAEGRICSWSFSFNMTEVTCHTVIMALTELNQSFPVSLRDLSR